MASDEHISPLAEDLSDLGGALSNSFVKGNVNINIGGTVREYCQCGCGLEIFRESAFMCPDCGRQPIRESCRDEELGNCRSCAEAWRAEDNKRGYCRRIALTVRLEDDPDPLLTVFLLPRRTVQLGRACADQHPVKTACDTYGGDYHPADNDVICRPLSGAAHDHEQVRSQLISRRHAAIRIARDRAREVPMVVDCGMWGHGSNSGTYLGLTRLPKGKWSRMSDDETLYLGRYQRAGLHGLAVRVRVLRAPNDRNQIDAIVMDRDDALAGRQRWVMVARRAAIGLGAFVPIPLMPDSDPEIEWGGVRVDGGRFVLDRAPSSPLGAREFHGPPAVPVVLSDGMEFSAGRFHVCVREITDRDFNRITPAGA